MRKQLDHKRDTLMCVYLSLKSAGDPNIYFIDGDGLLIAGQSGIYVDGIHPTSEGFSRIAERLAPQLLGIILWKRRDEFAPIN